MPSKIWSETTYIFPNFNSCTSEGWEWISNLFHTFNWYNHLHMLGLNQSSDKRGPLSNKILKMLLPNKPSISFCSTLRTVSSYHYIVTNINWNNGKGLDCNLGCMHAIQCSWILQMVIVLFEHPRMPNCYLMHAFKLKPILRLHA